MMSNHAKTASASERFQIWENFKDEVRERGMEILPQIVEEYGHTTLKKTAPDTFMGCCPFHVEKTPSFQVSSKGYYCHGAACGAKGDVFTFVMEKSSMNFKEAVLAIADRVGLIPPEDNLRRSDFKAMPRPEPKPVDPAEGMIKDPDLLKPHGLAIVPNSLYRPRPNRTIRLFKKGKEHADGTQDAPSVKAYRPEMVHEYRDVDNNLRMAILRLRFRDGRKFFLPIQAKEPLPDTPENLIKDGVSWHVENTPSDTRRPIYGAENLRAWINNPRRGPIVVVEGEKCKDYAQKAFAGGNTLFLSASGGYNANLSADWKELTDVMAEAGVVPRMMIVWPDADHDREMRDGTIIKTQELYAKQITSSFLRDIWASFKKKSVADNIDFVRVIPPEGVEKGWDMADAIDEGWTREKLISYMRKAVKIDLSHMDGHAPADEGSDLNPEDEELSMNG